MIVGVGVDIVEISRLERLLMRHGERAARHLLAPSEWADWEARPSARLLAKRFAAKEALAKALGCGLRHPVTLRNIAVSHNVSGQPHFHYAEMMATWLTQRGIKHCHLSLTDETQICCAFVIAESD